MAFCPIQVFLVWRSHVLKKKVLSFHVDETSDSVIHIPVKESQYSMSYPCFPIKT